MLPLDYGRVVRRAPQRRLLQPRWHGRRHVQHGRHVTVVAPACHVLRGHLKAVVRKALQVWHQVGVHIPVDDDVPMASGPSDRQLVPLDLAAIYSGRVINRLRPPDQGRGVILHDGENRGTLAWQLWRRRRASDGGAPIRPAVGGLHRHLEEVHGPVLQTYKRQLARKVPQLEFCPRLHVLLARLLRLAHRGDPVLQAPPGYSVLLCPTW
mmetsp:Transcript_62168/g.156978  ORF Transcript_62168/g.156978 Transcript_62168/m.156978 type:complete len:210 (+) Transcript_62168:611-1240(+)